MGSKIFTTQGFTSVPELGFCVSIDSRPGQEKPQLGDSWQL